MAVGVRVGAVVVDDVLDECPACTWWVPVGELVSGACSWCRGWPAGWWGGK